MSQGIHKTGPLGRLALVAALILSFVALMSPASPAHAHDELLGSDPAADSTVDALPPQLTLTFSGVIAPDTGASQVQVTDAAGTELTDGAPSTQDNVLTQPLSGEASGIVTVLWKVVSSDGHPISGEFAFTVAGASAPTETSTPSATPTETTTPTHETTPTPTPAPASDATSIAPWVVLGVLAALAAAAVVYLLASRARRRRALTGGSPTETAPSADR